MAAKEADEFVGARLGALAPDMVGDKVSGGAEEATRDEGVLLEPDGVDATHGVADDDGTAGEMILAAGPSGDGATIGDTEEVAGEREEAEGEAEEETPPSAGDMVVVVAVVLEVVVEESVVDELDVPSTQ